MFNLWSHVAVVHNGETKIEPLYVYVVELGNGISPGVCGKIQELCDQLIFVQKGLSEGVSLDEMDRATTLAGIDRAHLTEYYHKIPEAIAFGIFNILSSYGEFNIKCDIVVAVGEVPPFIYKS